MKVSIVIPSRERAMYLQESLRTVTAIDDDAVEILVSDNASTDDTRDVALSTGDPRVRYETTGERLSMRQNFEFALRQTTGDYVIMFGDDDGFIPGQFPVLRDILAAERPDTLSWDFLTYGWPAPGHGKSGGVRLTRAGSFGLPFRIDVPRRRALLEAAVADNSEPIPALYHGCMSRAFLDRLTGEGYPYFRARSPDTYISFRALQAGGNLWHIHHPLSINGFSPASTGGAMMNLGTANKKEAGSRFLREMQTDDVDDILPVTNSMMLAFLGTLETARHHYPEDPVTPDYLPWYRLCLRDAARKDATAAAEIQADLDAHAARFGGAEALAEARRLGPPSRQKGLANLRRTIGKLSSFRRSAKIGGENTIFTAARMCDEVLADGAQRVMGGSLSGDAAWRQARRRGNAFDKQL